MSELISLTQKHQSANDCMLKEKSEKKHQKINHAIQYCMENDCRGHKTSPLSKQQVPINEDFKVRWYQLPYPEKPKTLGRP